MKKNLINFAIIFAGIVLLVLGVSLSVAPITEFAKRNFLGWKKATAEMASFTTRTLANGSVEYLATFSYQIDNARYEIIQSNGEKIPSFDETKPVFYNPKNFSDATLGDFSILNLAVLVVPISGLILLVFGILNIRKAKTAGFFETEAENDAVVAKNQLSEVKLFGTIVNVESFILPNGVNSGVAIIQAKLPSGAIKQFRSEQIEGLTAGLLVSYQANPTPISISVSGGNMDDYYIDSEEIISAIRKSFETVRQINLDKEENV